MNESRPGYLHGADAKDHTEKELFARAKVQFDQLRNRYQHYCNIETDIDRSRYQVENILVDAICGLPRSVP